MEQQSLEVNADALELAESMLAREEVMRNILEETLSSAETGGAVESGRTVCGGSTRVLGPLSRGFARVTLPTCPVSVGGTWHTHITRDQFLNPVNSLPDFANVAFGLVDVSIVAGADTSHVVVATRDRGEMVAVLQEELGVDVATPDDVARAVISGAVTDPPAVREALYGRLSDPIAFRVGTTQPDLADRARGTEFGPHVANLAAPAVEMSGCEMYHRLAPRDSGRFERVVDQGRSCQDSLHTVARQAAAGDISIREQVIATTISVTVGNVIERLLFG